MSRSRVFLSLALVAATALVSTPVPLARAAAPRAAAVGSTIVLAWNDLGMHCINRYHADFSVLPPFNNLYAQVIRRGDANTPPQLLTSGVTLEYSIPGNTTSYAKTDFWTYAPALFGVSLPNDIGLTGKGLTGSLDLSGTAFSARGIPVTPWPDADFVNEHPFQNALVVARDAAYGVELARSTPVIPVSAEIGCVSTGCHSSVNSIVNGHEPVTGYDPNVRPILCAKCHASPALGTTGRPDAYYFSFRIHDAHQFLDQARTGTAVCYACHPGSQSQCLRGAMSVRHGLVCQDCHGGMLQVSSTIEHNGRVPWVNEPRCGDCHTAAYAENTGTLFRNSFGHGGVMCEGCHNSTHADVPARDDQDNANAIALQGYAGPLKNCAVCHGMLPAGGGPHGLDVTAVEHELLDGARPLRAFPNPMRTACAIEAPMHGADAGRLLVHDAQGRVVRLLEPAVAGGVARARWDGTDARGARVAPGTYFVRWQQAGSRAATRLTVVE